MANRVLRDWTTSEKMDVLSLGAEVFFTRLIMRADDYGSFHANTKLIKSALFPLKDYTIKNIDTWLSECVAADLIGHYEVDGKAYIRIKNFGQRLQNMKNAFPAPNGEFESVRCESHKVTVSHRESPLETKRNETEEETETESEVAVGGVSVWPSFVDFWDKYDKKQDRPKCLKKWEKIKQAAREKIMEHLELYVRSTPDIQFRKNPLTYLNSESWENEIIISNGTHQNGKPRITEQGSIDRLNSYT